MVITRIVLYRSTLVILAVAALAIAVTAESPPNPPANLVVVSVTGGTVVLQWQPTSTVQGYIVEAGSTPGASNIGRFFTGGAAPTIVGTNVAAGTYYVRVLGLNNGAESAPSNEVTLVVGSGCTGLPGPPGPLTSSVSGSSVQLSWGASTGQVSTYVFEIGSTAGATDLGTVELGSAATSYLASGVASGRYFVRVKARNPCGLSAASNDTTVVVSATTPTPSGPARLEIINAQAFTVLAGASAGQLVAAGEVINTGGTAASFVTVGTEVFSTTGSRLTGFVIELNGRSRRILNSGAIENWTLGPGETACFAFTLGQASTIGRYDVRLQFDAFPTAPLQGQLQPTVTFRPDPFTPTRLRVEPAMTNVGANLTAFNRVAFVMKDSAGRVVGCGSTPLYGATNASVPGLGTTNVIRPGETGRPFAGNAYMTTALNVESVATITAWPQWKE
jgi:hypothetical protein